MREVNPMLIKEKDVCPECGSELIAKNKRWYCPNDDCKLIFIKYDWDGVLLKDIPMRIVYDPTL